MKKNILIIHYNTPYLTECLVKSINLFVEDAIIYIFDNSNEKPFTSKFENVTVFDNTKGQIIDFNKWLEKYPKRNLSSGNFNKWGSAKHCYSVEKCMELIGENFILLDSDVLLKKDISELFDENVIFAGEIIKQQNSYVKRVLPFICYINVEMCKKNDIHYFYDKYMHGLVAAIGGDNYDTGAGFFVFANKFPYREIKYENYIIHYGNGSWTPSVNNSYYKLSVKNWLNINKKYWSMDKNKKVIYTCITGGYDGIIEPQQISDGFDYVCFTDDESMKSNIWDIRPLPKETEGLSQVKKQRYVKINPHLLLNEYDISIWVDGNVTIKSDLNKFVSENVVDNCSVYVPKHPQRNCIYAEEKVVLKMGKDKIDRTRPQIDRYRKEGFPENYGLLQSNILLRKHNEQDCIKLMEEWFNELKNGSHRDQLSFNYAAWKHQDVKIVYLDKNICKSNYFCCNGGHRRYGIGNSSNLAKHDSFVKIKKNKPTTNKTKIKSIAQLKGEFYQMISANKIPTYDVGIY